MTETIRRYHAVAIVLHWAIAAAILANIAIGLWMHKAIDVPATALQAANAYQLHKSVGLTVIILSFGRLAWRLFHPPPPLPTHMPRWEILAARVSHWGFYMLMIALPLSGWLYVSAQWRGDAPFIVATRWFGLVGVPHLFGLAEASSDVRMVVARLAIETHELLAWGMLGLLALHVAAALKHQFVDRDEVLSHMVPSIRAPGVVAPPSSLARRLVLSAGFGAIAAGAAAAGIAFFQKPAPQSIGTDRADLMPVAVPTGTATIWTIDRAASEIAFSGKHVGVPFRGRFSRWGAGIRFSENDLAGSGALVTVDAASAADGVALHDQALPGAEWFDVQRNPTMSFRTTRMRRSGADYEADGVLTIKGRSVALALPFKLRIDRARATMTGQARVARRAADLGMQSDPTAKYVSADIIIDVRVSATQSAE